MNSQVLGLKSILKGVTNAMNQSVDSKPPLGSTKSLHFKETLGISSPEEPVKLPMPRKSMRPSRVELRNSEKKTSSTNLNRSKTTLMSSKQQEAEDATLISGAKGNLMTLRKQQVKSFMAHFTGKHVKVKPALDEFKYCLNLMLSMKETVAFIENFTNVKVQGDLEKEIRLNLHTYFDCEFTIMMKVKEHADGTAIHAFTSKS